MMLVCFDMDGVIFETKNFWMDVHKAYGTYDEGLELTRKYLHTDYEKLVKEVVWKLWRGKDARVYDNLVQSVPYMRGMDEVFLHIKKNRWKTAIISSGSLDLAKRAQADYGINFIFANEIGIKDRKISGEFKWPLGAGGEKKAELLKTLCKNHAMSVKEAAFIGDSETDIAAFGIAGISIAFNAENDIVRKAARYVIDTKNLKDVVPLLVERDADY